VISVEEIVIVHALVIMLVVEGHLQMLIGVQIIIREMKEQLQLMGVIIMENIQMPPDMDAMIVDVVMKVIQDIMHNT
jgi:hypothetical protein